MQPFASDLAHRLAAVSVYDREIHIRRAASAAFQENVGRQVGFGRKISPCREECHLPLSHREYFPTESMCFEKPTSMPLAFDGRRFYLQLLRSQSEHCVDLLFLCI